MAYETCLAAALSGATVRQLRRWRSVLQSEYAARPILYSFRDVLALRAFVYLHQEVPLQEIRRAVADERESIAAHLSDVLQEFTPRAGVVVPHLLRPKPHITVDPETQGGRPVITGTRVPYDAVAELIEDGIPPTQIAAYYPGVSVDAARDAASFALYVDSYRVRTRQR